MRLHMRLIGPYRLLFIRFPASSYGHNFNMGQLQASAAKGERDSLVVIDCKHRILQVTRVYHKETSEDFWNDGTFPDRQ